MRPPVCLAVLLAATSFGLAQTCGPNGLSLTITGDRIGDPISLSLNGTPFVNGHLGFDVSGGPTQTPIGVACLGLTPQLQTYPFSLNAQGQFTLSGVLPPNPALNGFGVYVQAAGHDLTQPGGFALSNGAHPVLRPPRIFFHPVGLYSQHCWFSYDVLTDTPGPVVSLPGQPTNEILIPALGWYAVVVTNWALIGNVVTATCTFRAFDAATGATVVTFPLPTAPSGPAWLAADGTTLYVLFAAQGQPTYLRSYSLTTGAPLVTVSLPYGVDQIIAVPGSGIVYARDSVLPGFRVVDMINGAVAISIPFGQLLVGSYKLRNGILYATMGVSVNPSPMPPTTPPPSVPPAVVAIDTATHAIVHGPVSIGTPGTALLSLDIGPGPFGSTALWAGDNHGYIWAIDTSTFAVAGPAFGCNALWYLGVSPGGTEFLGVCNGYMLALNTSNPSSGATAGPIATAAQLVLSVPSATLRKAYTLNTPNQLAVFTTDPITFVGMVPLPVWNPISAIVD